MASIDDVTTSFAASLALAGGGSTPDWRRLVLGAMSLVLNVGLFLWSCSASPLSGVFSSYEVVPESVLLLDLHSLGAYGGLAGTVSDDWVVVTYSRHGQTFLAMY
ncbi:hypothetical protein ACLB2K_052144 [Fragaria x ananassa]